MAGHPYIPSPSNLTSPPPIPSEPANHLPACPIPSLHHPPNFPPPTTSPVAKSFAATLVGPALPRSPKLEIPNRNRVLRDGKPALYFTPAELKAGAAQLQHALIAKFSAGKPKSEVIKLHIQSAWHLSGPFSTGSLDGRHELIMLSSAEDVIQALACSSHQIGDYLFRLFRWSPDFNLKKESAKSAVWVRIPLLSLLYFEEGFLQQIGNSIGTFLKVDDRTLDRVNPAFARILVEIDLKAPLIKDLYLGPPSGEGGETYDIIYEGKLGYCNKCNKQGHVIADCRKIKNQILYKELNQSRSTNAVQQMQNRSINAGTQMQNRTNIPQMQNRTNIPQAQGKKEWMTVQKNRDPKVSFYEKQKINPGAPRQPHLEEKHSSIPSKVAEHTKNHPDEDDSFINSASKTIPVLARKRQSAEKPKHTLLATPQVPKDKSLDEDSNFKVANFYEVLSQNTEDDQEEDNEGSYVPETPEGPCSATNTPLASSSRQPKVDHGRTKIRAIRTGERARELDRLINKCLNG